MIQSLEKLTIYIQTHKCNFFFFKQHCLIFPKHASEMQLLWLTFELLHLELSRLRDTDDVQSKKETMEAKPSLCPWYSQDCVEVPDLRVKTSRISSLHNPQSNEHTQKHTESFTHPEPQEGRGEKGSNRAPDRNRLIDFSSHLWYSLAMRCWISPLPFGQFSYLLTKEVELEDL